MAKFKTLLAVLALVSNSAFAALITLETKDIPAGFAEGDLASAFDTLAGGTVNNLTSLANINKGKNKIYKLTIEWNQLYTNSWMLDINLDAGLGAEMFVNGALVLDRTDDIYWGHGDKISQVLDFTYGAQEIVLVWAEACCAGKNFINLTDLDTQANGAMDIDSINAARIPEPQTLALMGMGFAGLMFSRRRAK